MTGLEPPSAGELDLGAIALGLLAVAGACIIAFIAGYLLGAYGLVAL